MLFRFNIVYRLQCSNIINIKSQAIKNSIILSYVFSDFHKSFRRIINNGGNSFHDLGPYTFIDLKP